MSVLDTDDLSAVTQRAPPEAVIAWLDRQAENSLWTTAVTVFEIEYGLQRLPDGSRRRSLEASFRAVLTDDLAGRVLPFDARAAVIAGALSAQLETVGRPVDVRDVHIAAIPRAHRAPLATRNVRHFELACDVVNPWEEQ